ncbi:MAG: rRNA maturation RNase YbeY [Patescibacteria group bacterium]|nr:rRNA maturation RNase YbeY [Patescibacteria group bacterium]
MITIVCPSRYALDKKAIRKRVSALMFEKQINTRSILNIIFVGTRKMREIARAYKHEDEALPVLAFPYKDIDLAGDQLLGEIFLCYPQVILLAAERSKKVDDMIFRLIEHGLNNILQDTSTPV